MTTMRAPVLALLLLALAAAARPGAAQTTADSAAVRAAVLDYVEGLYQVDPARVDRSVSPELAKRSVAAFQGTGREYLRPMSKDVLLNVAATFNREGRTPRDARREVVILDMLDRTAAVRLTAVDWVDYMHLARLNGRWTIVNILWQDVPPAAP
jgi:putative lumazine-binding protein